MAYSIWRTFFPVVYKAFFKKPQGEVSEASFSMTVPLALTAGIVLILGVFPDAGLSLYRLAWQAANSVVGTGEIMGYVP